MGALVIELWAFLKERKKFWLLPLIIVLVVFGRGLSRDLNDYYAALLLLG